MIFFQKFLPIILVLPKQSSLFESPPDGNLDLFEFKGFADVVEGAFADRLDRCVDRSEGGDHDDGGFRRGLFEGSKDIHPIFLPHPDIRDDDIKKIFDPPGDGLFSAQGRDDLIAFFGEDLSEQIEGDRIIVHNQETG